jgi:hypothetical protein
LAVAPALFLCACGGSDGGGGDLAAGGGDQAMAPGRDLAGSDLSGMGTPDSSSPGDSGIAPGALLFEEKFDDANLMARGWYDSPSGAISMTEHAPGSTSSFQCDFAVGATACTGGVPARHKLTPSSSVFLRVWIKFSANWVGSGKPYHPHMFHFVTDLEPDYIGPADTHLTTYAEVVGGNPLVGITDALNSDPNCILRNDGTFVGCNGSFANYPFTEKRSVASCNGLVGDVDQHDCFFDGTYWYSARTWITKTPWFTDVAGPNYKNDWHKMEFYYQMNTISAGVGVPDGKHRLWIDGALIESSDKVLFRTGDHPTIEFAQFLMLPYIGDGSPIAQTFWVDDLAVGTGPF